MLLLEYHTKYMEQPPDFVLHILILIYKISYLPKQHEYWRVKRNSCRSQRNHLFGLKSDDFNKK